MSGFDIYAIAAIIVAAILVIIGIIWTLT